MLGARHNYRGEKKRRLAKGGPGLVVGALFATLLTVQALLGILNKWEKRVWYLESDAVLLLVTYLLGLYVVYRVGR